MKGSNIKVTQSHSGQKNMRQRPKRIDLKMQELDLPGAL